MSRWILVVALFACDDGGSLAVDPKDRDAAADAADAAEAADAGADAATDQGADVAGDAAPVADAADPPDAGPLRAVPGASRYADIGGLVLLDGSASTGAVAYQWNFGDGRGWDAPRPEAVADVIYDRPGRFAATLTVFDRAGRRHTAATTISVTKPNIHAPIQSATIVANHATAQVSVVVPDDDAVVFIDGQMNVTRWATCRHPRTIALWGGGQVIVAACPESDEVQAYRFSDQSVVTGVLPRASAPNAVIGTSNGLFVALSGTGQVARFVAGDAAQLALTDVWDVVEDPRAMAVLPDGRIAVSRWRSPEDGAVIGVLDPRTGAVERWRLQVDPQLASDTEIGGVPSYLEQVVVSPAADEIAVPSLQANVHHGPTYDGLIPQHDTVLRATVSFLDPSGAERFAARKQFDNRGFASAAAYSSRGDYLFVATRGSRSVERLDRLSDNASGTILDVGYAPDGLVVLGDRLYVNASLSRTVVVYDLGSGGEIPLDPLAVIPTVEREPLPPEILRGKQLFNDSFDVRLSRDGYIACAHCHLDGDSDHFVWDFTARGEGRRNTISLLGRSGGQGFLHWSANFDEVQDFEHDIRGPFGGLGLMSDADFAGATPLGAAKAGRSEDLDALAAYVQSLSRERPSPFRTADGGLSEAARRGRAVYDAAGCDVCHAGPDLTDSGPDEDGQPRLHDVGTLAATSGQRLGGPLLGLDTPTLHGLWHSAPYLHDGSAPTLRAVFDRNGDDRHGVTQALTDAQLDDLEQYLLSLDRSE